MARDLTTDVSDELNADRLRPAILVTAEFDSGDLNLWSGQGNITYNDVTYTGAANVLVVSTVAESQKLQANGLTFTLNGVQSSLNSIALTEEYQSRPISMQLAVMTNEFQIIDDPYLLFSGEMDVMEIADQGDTSTIAVKAENDLIALKETNERRYTHEDQIAAFAGDMGLEFMPTNADVEITWGASS